MRVAQRFLQFKRPAWESVLELAMDLKQRVFGPLDEEQSARLERRDLSAEL